MAGRGRGRGRARGRVPATPPEPPPQAVPGGRGGPGRGQAGQAGARQPQAAQPPASSARGPSPGASAVATQVPSTQQGDMTGAMAQMSLGRVASATGPVSAASHSGDQVGRGAYRGRQRIVEDFRPRTRPDTLETKKGTTGRHLKLVANYFALREVPDQPLRQYRVDIAPEEDRTSERKFLLRAYKERLQGHVFDGTVLFTTAPITSPQNNVLTWTSSNRDNSQTYTLTIRQVGEVQRGDYVYIQIFNMILRDCFRALNLQMIGRDYFDPEAKILVPHHGMELWPGYKTSIRQHESSILMCVEITHKVMRTETVFDILNNCIQGGGEWKREFMREVVGVIVLTKYNNKTYRIDDVNWDLKPSSTFRFGDEMISFAEYMKRKYQINIGDVKQPLLVSLAKARDVRAGMSEVVNLIPEVCYCTGLTDNMRSNFRLMKDLGQYTKVSPDGRIRKLQSFNERLQINEQARMQFQRFGMALGTDLVQVPGRALNGEKILFRNGGSALTGPTVDWTRELRNQQLLLAKNLTDWVVVCPSRSKTHATSFIGMLKQVARGMGLSISDPRYLEIQRDGSGDYVQALNQVMDSCQPQLIMCCVPNNRADRYVAIKKKCCVDRPVPTQLILCKNLNDPKKSMSIATKVAVQINCKVGGAAWAVDVPMQKLMIVGFDVCHDTSSKSRSIGAMVASLDKAMSRYFSAVTPHLSGEELSTDLALNVVKAVRKYLEHNGYLPSSIVMYRDGVGEGQLRFVVDVEVKEVEEKLAVMYASHGVPLKLSYIIVTKRINTRLFTDRRENPPPGCVVDDVVTDPEKFDFFLVSQSVRDGTVSPTSYNVIHNTCHLSADILQRLSYKLCHMYFNWSGTVRVPAPCQYAHKLAFLVGQALHREPNSVLEDLLYFL